MSADVTKELLIKIGTEGAEGVGGVFDGMDLSFSRMMGGIIGINNAWELFRKVTGLARDAIMTVWDAGEQLTDTASTFEQLGIRFRTIFGGAGPAQEALDWAVKFAALTPMTLEDVTAKMLKLKAYGFDPMSGILETIGDASYAVGADFDGIVVALGQMGLKGKVVQQELNQLSERNIPAIRWLREDLGLTAKQMENIGAQGIKSDLAIQIILKHMREEYAGGMKAAGDSWAGAISTILDTFTIFQKRIMDSGPFAFMVANIREVRDAFSEWLEFSGSNLGFRMGGVILDYLKTAKAFVLDDLIPGVQVLAEMGYNAFRTFLPVYNTFVDIAGIVGGPIIAGIREILRVTGFLGPALGDVTEALRASIPHILAMAGDLLTWVYRTAREAWLGLKTLIIEDIYLVKQIIGETIANFAASKVGGNLLGYLGDTGETEAFGRKLEMAATRKLAEIEQWNKIEYEGIKDSSAVVGGFFSGMAKDLGKMFQMFSDFKIDALDPFGLSRLSQTAGDTSSHTLWQKGVNEQTGGKVLWEKQTEKETVSKVQLGAPPGDPLLELIVKYINRAIEAEGTISGGF